MNKKILAVALTGLLALPLVPTGHADAATTQSNSSKTACYKLYYSWNVGDDSLAQLITELNKKGIFIHSLPTSLSGQKATSGQTHQGQSTQTGKSTNSGQSGNQEKSSNSGQSTSANQPSSTQNNSSKTSSQLNAYEQKVVDLVNQERAKQGLKALKTDNSTLSKMARDKAQDMRDNNYFDHQSPTYGSPFDMMKKYGISYSAAGENIAAGQKTPEDVMKSWMNSSGHRANILNANYTTIGVGYVTGGSYGTYWVQEFIGK